MAGKRTFVKLGYSHLDTAEIVTLLNRLLANYMVFQQKLRKFHWNVEGADFFELHEKFEEMYNQTFQETDQIAERIRLFDQYPVTSFTEYIELSTIKEVTDKYSSFEMVAEILKDIRTILEIIEEGIYSAKEIGDFGTEHLLKKLLLPKEKNHWMLTVWMKETE